MISTIIPPIPNLELAAGRKYLLLLSHLLHIPAYKRFYATQSLGGAYLILDNSAHERQFGEAAATLLSQAEELGVSEIVCPDHLFDSDDTIRRTREALQFFVTNEKRLHQMTPIPRMMLVAQGNSLLEYSLCLQGLIKEFLAAQKKTAFPSNFLPTIGVSKDYELWEGGMHRLLEKTVLPVAATLPDVQIHLLGWGRDLWALRQIVEDFGDRIRSIDSAKPMVYGAAKILLDPAEPSPTYPKRSKYYFITELSKEQLVIVRKNIEVFDAVVSGGTDDIRLRTLSKMST